jgi:dTDP-4-dehydrorhamnose 3,5-epimerase
LILRAAEIDGVTLLEPEPIADERGTFARTFDAMIMQEAGLVSHFPEHSVATNPRVGTLRGLHYQIGIVPEAKVIRCTQGRIYDVVVDLRRLSPTFAQWVAFTLGAEQSCGLYIPPGCAHGYQTLDRGTIVAYMISAPYEPSGARGVNYADPRLGITWPLPVGVISSRDEALPYVDVAELPPV